MARILIVEDESVAAWYLQEALENMGHNVVGSVVSGEEAIQVAGETQPTLILMDIRLQDEMDGIAAVEQIRLSFDIPVIYLTAHADDVTLSRAIATNPYGYLVKPFQEREVYTTIEIALRQHTLHQHQEETKNWLANTLNSIAHATIVTDRDGTITFINPVAEALTGWLQQDAIGNPATAVLTFIHTETRQEIETSIVQALQEGKAAQLPERCLLRTKSGQEKPISDMAAPIKNNNGEIIGSVIILQDIASQQQALSDIQQRNLTLELNQVSLIARLQERTVQLQQAIACTQILKRLLTQGDDIEIQNSILERTIQELGRLLDTDYCWVALHDAHQTLATISCEYIAPDELNNYSSALGETIEMQNLPDFYCPLLQRDYWLCPPVDLLPPFYQSLLTAKSQLLICPLVEQERVIGEVGILSTTKLSWPQPQAELICQAINQCTAILRQVYSCETTQDSVSDLRVLNELKEKLLSSVLHQLRTPLNNLKIAVEMLSCLVHCLECTEVTPDALPNRQQLRQKLVHYLQILREEWQREFDLVCDLLNFQSVESLTKTFPFNWIDLQQYLPEIINRFSTQPIHQWQAPSYQISPELPALFSHEPSLMRIITELLTNACKFSPSDSWISVKAEVEGENILINVTNTGVTIPLEECDRIFQPFYRIPHPNLRHYSGTGLGLALVKKLVQLLGGEIQVQSNAEETAFTLTLSPGQHLLG
ncbi:MAG TPA: ATP-binding protein [Coleofasciculaceae cyanobacterium]